MTTYKSFHEALSPVQTSSEARTNRHLAGDGDNRLARPDDHYNPAKLRQEIERQEVKRDIIEKQLVALKLRVSKRTDWNTHARDKADLQLKGQEHQKILRSLSALRREERQQKENLNDYGDARLFIQCARELLSRERYEDIWRAVEEKQIGRSREAIRRKNIGGES
jgi:hypothetical protein